MAPALETTTRRQAAGLQRVAHLAAQHAAGQIRGPLFPLAAPRHRFARRGFRSVRNAGQRRRHVRHGGLHGPLRRERRDGGQLARQLVQCQKFLVHRQRDVLQHAGDHGQGGPAGARRGRCRHDPQGDDQTHVEQETDPAAGQHLQPLRQAQPPTDRSLQPAGPWPPQPAEPASGCLARRHRCRRSGALPDGKHAADSRHRNAASFLRITPPHRGAPAFVFRRKNRHTTSILTSPRLRVGPSATDCATWADLAGAPVARLSAAPRSEPNAGTEKSRRLQKRAPSRCAGAKASTSLLAQTADSDSGVLGR